MRLLELFKGTGSVGNSFKKLYPECEIYSLDILKKYHPTYCGDIMDWDFKQYPKDFFKYVWASPECKIYSTLQYGWLKTGKRGEKGIWDNHEHLDKVRLENGKYVKKVLEIIDYFEPTYWFIENPKNSTMKDLPYMKDLPFVLVDYCRFGTIYKKPTRRWTNKKLDNVLCKCEKTHKFILGCNSKELCKKKGVETSDKTNTDDRYYIPHNLIKYLFT